MEYSLLGHSNDLVGQVGVVLPAMVSQVHSLWHMMMLDLASCQRKRLHTAEVAIWDHLPLLLKCCGALKYCDTHKCCFRAINLQIMS